VSGIGGYVGVDGDGNVVLSRMSDGFAWPLKERRIRHESSTFGLVAVGPANGVAIARSGPVTVAVHGHPVWPAARAGLTDVSAVAAAVAEAINDNQNDVVERMRGDFSLAAYDERSERLRLCVDRIGVRNLFYTRVGRGWVFGATADVVRRHPAVSLQVDAQGIYDYVYFHMVPGPRTVFQALDRVPPAHEVVLDASGAHLRRYWQLGFAEDRHRSLKQLRSSFMEALRNDVRPHALLPATGAFLSGGTDSSTVSGLLGELAGSPAETFSIGFASEGYDEMEYARIASRHFKTRHHEYYVTPDDVVDAIPAIAGAFDQPFGNASAVPTYFCARLAREHGIDRMLGGDGGDELFGGNARYGRQWQLSLYDRVPRWLRSTLVEPLLLTSTAARLPLVRKARSYVEQARLPMPSRYESYNLLERLGAANVFEPEFLATVAQGHPHEISEDAWRESGSRFLVNRMLAMDLRLTLADNDLLKVTRSCELAGIDVAFPLLSESVVALSSELPPDYKLRRTQLRWFFKHSLVGFLPQEIIAKQKHGFGLPVGPWLASHPPLTKLAHDALHSLRARNIARADLLEDLLGRRLQEHPAYYGTLAWVLMMLELWFQQHAPGTRY
jgi:asparagine synthase (glutamine-hydrolysing)